LIQNHVLRVLAQNPLHSAAPPPAAAALGGGEDEEHEPLTGTGQGRTPLR
jgi:hypothetical protein